MKVQVPNFFESKKQIPINWENNIFSQKKKKNWKNWKIECKQNSDTGSGSKQTHMAAVINQLPKRYVECTGVVVKLLNKKIANIFRFG